MILYSLLVLLGFASPGVDEVNLAQLQSRIHRSADTTYVVNFWATWCRPCIEELPAFEALARKHSKEPVAVLLVSLDAPNERETKVEPFIRRKGYDHCQVVVLNEPKPHLWIDRVDQSWSGSIPATLFLKGQRRLFGEFQFNEELLDSTFTAFQRDKK